MGVPRYIEDKMHRAAMKFSEANALLSEVEDYFSKKGITNEVLEKRGCDIFSDLRTYDVTKGLIKNINEISEKEDLSR